MASLNPPIVEDLSQLALPRHAVIVGFSEGPGGREVLLARRDGMHLDVSIGTPAVPPIACVVGVCVDGDTPYQNEQA